MLNSVRLLSSCLAPQRSKAILIVHTTFSCRYYDGDQEKLFAEAHVVHPEGGPQSNKVGTKTIIYV